MDDLKTVAVEFQNYMTGQIGFVVTAKETSDIMRAVATGMDLATHVTSGIPAGNDFMEKYATTLGKEVYIPKSIRDNPLSMIDVLTHEGEHVLQYKATGVEFVWFYGTDQAARAQFEADAYAAGTATRTWLTGKVPSNTLSWILDALVRGYHLRPEDRKYAETALKSHFASLNSGIYGMTTSGRMAVKFFESKYPQLKGTITA